MPALDSPSVQILLSILGPGGLAALAVKMVLNGTKENVKEIKEDVKQTRASVTRLHQRVDTLELDAADRAGYERAMREMGDKPQG